MSKKATAIVIASSPTSDAALARLSPNGCKSMIEINGRPAVGYVLDNLRGCESISGIALVSDKETNECVGGSEIFVEASGGEAEKVIAGVRAAEGADLCLLMTGDLPLANAEAIDDLLKFAPDCDVVYPVVEKADVKEVFPSREAYYVGTSEGQFTGSSLLLFKPEVALSKERLIIDLLNVRSNPTALLGMLGAGMAMKLIFSKPTIGEFEAQLSKSLGVDCRVFISHYPELVFSIDSPEDIKLIEAEISQ